MNCECEVLHMNIFEIAQEAIQNVIGCPNNLMTREKIIMTCCGKLEQLRCSNTLINDYRVICDDNNNTEDVIMNNDAVVDIEWIDVFGTKRYVNMHARKDLE